MSGVRLIIVFLRKKEKGNLFFNTHVGKADGGVEPSVGLAKPNGIQISEMACNRVHYGCREVAERD